jgi:hypothetical protein
MPPTQMVRALALLYEATGGDAWRTNFKWMSGEPCVDGWFGVHCCPQSLPVLRGDDECTADGGGATGVRTTQGSAACHSGSVTGTALDLATCVVVKVLLPSNNLIGSLEGALGELQNLQHLDLSGNALIGALPSTADCLPQLTSLDLAQTRSWDDQGGVTGTVPVWLLDRLKSLAPLRLANNAFDDPTAAESAAAIRRLWLRCSTLGAEQCSGVPPIGCSAFNRQGQRYEVELDGLGCVRCPTPLEIIGIAVVIAVVVLFLVLGVGGFTRFMRKYPEYAKTHVASFMIIVGHLQMLTIIGSMQLGWPLVIQQILASINLPLMGYIPLPCILTDPLLKALLSYAETAVVLLLLVSFWVVAQCSRKAWAEYNLSVLFGFLFTVGLRASATLFMRYDEDQTRLIIARLVATLLWLFWLFLLRRFRGLLVTAAAAEARAAAAKAWVEAATAAAEAARVARAARAEAVLLQKKARRAADAVRYLTERYRSDDGPGGARWPLRSQWQLVVWARQGLLFLVSFFMDCVMSFSPYEAHRAARYVFAALAIAVLGGFWQLQAWRRPYAMPRHYWLEALLYAVDISAIVLACLYGAHTNDGAVQDGFGRLALELILGALLIVSVVGAAMRVFWDVTQERKRWREWVPPSLPTIDEPIEAALRDGAVRLIDCAWLLDSDRSDRQLPRVTKVVARLSSNEPTGVLIRRLATHCGTSSICITVEAASAASLPPSPPPSPPEVQPELAEAGGHRQGGGRARVGARMRQEQEELDLALAISASLAEQEQKEQRDRLAAAELVGIRTVVRERTNASPAQSSTVIAPQSSAPLASEPPLHHNDSVPLPLQPNRSRPAMHERNEPARVHASGVRTRTNASPLQSWTALARWWSSARVAPEFAASAPPPSSDSNTFDVTFHLSTFNEVAPLTAAGLRRKAEAVKERLAVLGAEDIRIVTGKPFLPRCQDMPEEAFLEPQDAAALFRRPRRGVRGARVLSYCWRMPGMPDPDGCTLEKIRGYMNLERGRQGGECGLFVDVACLPQNYALPSWHAMEAITKRFGTEADIGPLTVLKFELERVATEEEAQVCVDEVVSLCEQQRWELAPLADFESLGLSSRGHVSVLVQERYIMGVSRFDKGASPEGYVRFRTPHDANAARHHPDFMFGGKEPELMGEHVFENELKFKRGLSVMGCLYASATGTCVLQLKAPPGELNGDDVAPSELVSERMGTVFVVSLRDKSLEEPARRRWLEELHEELGDGVLACEKGPWGEVVVRVYGETAARAVRSLNEGGYPLRRKDRVVYPMYSLRPYGSRGWPTFETAAASIVVAHHTQRTPPVAQAEESGPKLINIDLIDAPRVVEVVQSPERHLLQCKKKLLSKQIFFTGKGDQKDVVQLLFDFEDSVSVEVDQRRARHSKFSTEDLEHEHAARQEYAERLGDARRTRSRKLLQRLTFL